MYFESRYLRTLLVKDTHYNVLPLTPVATERCVLFLDC
jgi:hypothetical protein